jgi:hypothetical protein
MNNVTLSGEAGTVLWSYHQVAHLRSWTLSKNEAGQLTLSGTLTFVDHYRVTQRPLVFLVRRPQGIWRWPITELQMAGGAFTAYLGPRE